jgi:predicted ATP-dependent serine protease
MCPLTISRLALLQEHDLVGRESEFKRVASLLEDAFGTHPLILIGGEAGIGRSRLLEAVLVDRGGTEGVTAEPAAGDDGGHAR